MCMTFSPTRKEVIGFLAVCIIFSPVLIAGGIVYGVGKGVKTVAKGILSPVGAAVQRRRARNESSNTRVFVPEAEWTTAFNDALQAAYERSIAEPTFSAFTELAVALYAKQDYYGAHSFFLKGEKLIASGSAKPPAYEHAVALYVHGLTLQFLGQFGDSAMLFARAADLLRGASGEPCVTLPKLAADDASSDDSAETPTICRTDAQLQAAYSRYLSVVYPKVDVRCGGAVSSHDRDAALTQVVNALDHVLSVEPHSQRAKLIRAFAYFQLYLPSHPGLSLADSPYHDACLPLAYQDCKDVFDWARTATDEQLFEEGMLPSDSASLLAHLLLAMGELQQAHDLVIGYEGAFGASYPQSEAFNSVAVHSDPELLKSFLCNPWPLPPSVTVDTSVEKHNFEKHFFKTPTYCDYCMTFISFAQNRSAARCTICKYEVHGECLAAAKENFCLATREVSEKTANVTHTHVFIEHRLHRVRDCVVCGDSIMIGTTGAQCSQCNQYCHKRCVEKADAVHSPKLKN